MWGDFPTRLNLIKNIVTKLEDLNIVYVKVFQSLCINKHILSHSEKDFLIKYTDNVPFKSEEVDYDIIDKLEQEYNIRLDTSEHVNAGIVSVVFKGIYNDDSNKVVIKILKKNIREKLEQVFNDILILAKMCKYIPYLNSLNLDIILADNKDVLLNQTDFNCEVANINIFKEKYGNLPEYKIPKVYGEITDKYENVIVMENIKGLTYNDIEKMDNSEIKNSFANLIMKFAHISILFHNAVHCDLHSGNIFFYINEKDNDNIATLPKYQVGLIDFGIVAFPSKTEQSNWYNFLHNAYNKNFDNYIETSLKYFFKDINVYNDLSINQKKILNDDCARFFKDEDEKTDIIASADVVFNMSNLFKKYNIRFSSDFNKMLLSIMVSNSLSIELSNDIKKNIKIVFDELDNVNRLLEI